MNGRTPTFRARAVLLALAVAPGVALAETLTVGDFRFPVPSTWAVPAGADPVQVVPAGAASPQTVVVLPAATTPAPGADLSAVLAEGWRHLLESIGTTEVSRAPEESLTTAGGRPAAVARGSYRGVDGREYQAAIYTVQNGDTFSFVYFFAGEPADFDRFLPSVTAMVRGAQPTSAVAPGPAAGAAQPR
ncbi:MAG: hypothetical protein ACRD0X_02610 [Thermoanaerobaculia bacterium]